MYIYSIKISVPHEPTQWYIGASTKPERYTYWGSGHRLKTHIEEHGTKYLQKFILERGFTSIATLSTAEENAIGRFKRLYGQHCLNDTDCGIIASFPHIRIPYDITPTIELPRLNGTLMSYEQFLDCVKGLNYGVYYNQCMRCVTKYGVTAIEATYNAIDKTQLPTRDGTPITYKQFRDYLRDGHEYCTNLFNRYRVEPASAKRTYKKKSKKVKQPVKKTMNRKTIYNSIPKHELPQGHDGPICYARFYNSIRVKNSMWHEQCTELFDKYKP